MSFPFGNYVFFHPGPYYPSYEGEQLLDEAEGRMDTEIVYGERPRQYDHGAVEQVQFLPSRSIGHWQSEQDLPYRRIMIAEMYVPHDTWRALLLPPNFSKPQSSLFCIFSSDRES